MADILTNAAEGLDAFLGNLGNVADKYLDLEEIIPSVSDLLIDQSSEIKKLNKELGNGSKLASNLRGEFADLSKAIGVSTADILDLLSTTKKYHQGLKSSTSYTLQFMKASGASSSIVGTLSARLNILNKTSDRTFNAMYTNILSVRDAYGLTSDQIDEVLMVVDKYAVATQASNQQIEQGTIALAKFTSQLTSAGIEADKVSEILNSMIDPDQLMNNVTLMSKIGISVNDMVSGDPLTKLEGATEKLKQLGQEISEIAKTNRFQANEVAKVYSLTLEQANLLANLDTSDKALQTQKKLEEFRNEMATFADGIEALKNTIGGMISGPLSKIGAILENLGNSLGLLGKGIIGLVGIWLGKKLINALRSGLENIIGQAAKIFSKEMGRYLGAADARLKAKDADASMLSPKIAKNAEKLGFGYNLKAKQEEKAEAKRIKRLGKGKVDGLETSEILEGLESYKKFLEDMDKKIDELPIGSTKRQALEEKFKQRGAALEKYSKLMENYGDVLNPKFKGSEQLKNYKNARGGGIQGAAKNLVSATLGDDLFSKSDAFKNEDAQKGIANVLKEGDFKTQKEALEAIKDFLNNSNFDGAHEGVKAINEELQNMESTAKNAQEAMEEATDTLEGMAEAAKGDKAPLGSRIKSFVQGGLNSIKDIAGKALIGGAAGLAIGIGSKIIGGIGEKFTESLQKNEKFQESMEKISGKINEIFDNIVAAFEPIMEPLTNFIVGVINFIQPAIEGIVGVLGGIFSIFGKNTKKVENISESVATIEDSYKKEDLKTMYRLEGAYDTDNDAIIALLGKVVYKIDDVTKNQKENTNVQVARYLTGGGNNNG